MGAEGGERAGRELGQVLRRVVCGGQERVEEDGCAHRGPGAGQLEERVGGVVVHLEGAVVAVVPLQRRPAAMAVHTET